MLNLCGLVGGNTGVVLCDRVRGLPKKLVVGGKAFDPSDYATPDALQAAIKAAVKLPTGDSDKLFPFPEIGGTTIQTDALKTATLGYGLKQITIEGRPGYEYQVQVGQTTFQQMRKFNRAIVPVYTIDDGNAMWSTRDASTQIVTGEMAQLFVSGNGFGDGTAPFVATVSIAYQSAGDFNDFSAYAVLNFNINEARGLLSVALSEYAVHAANVYHIAGLIPTAQLGVSLNVETDGDNGTIMADEAMWVLKKADGTTVAITSVADVVGKGWTVTIDSTAYGALATGTKLFLSWVGPVALDAADVTELENVDPLILIK